MGYPIFALRSLKNPSGGRVGPVDFVRGMEEALIRLCAGLGVHAGRIAGMTGVWVGQKPGNREKGIATEMCIRDSQNAPTTSQRIDAVIPIRCHPPRRFPRFALEDFGIKRALNGCHLSGSLRLGLFAQCVNHLKACLLYTSRCV